MANTLVTPSWVTKSTALGYINNLKYVKNLTMKYNDEFIQAGAKVGDTINVRMPVRFPAARGQALVLQNILEQTVPVTLTDQIQVGMGWSSAQATTAIQEVKDRYVKPAANSLANQADVLAYTSTFLDVYNVVGTLGTPPGTTQTFLNAGVLLSDGAVPTDSRVAVLELQAMANLSNSVQTLFNPSAKISENFKTGQFGGDTLGIEEWYYDQNVQSYLTGTFTASTPLVNNAGQTGASLVTDGWASGATTLNRGDTFTIGGVYSVNPESYSATPRLQRFVVTATTSDTTGDMTIPISPSIITSGPLQTVSVSPANNAVITVFGATSAAGGTLAATNSPQSLIFHPEFATFVNADLAVPAGGAKYSFVQSKEFNISIRWVEQYNIGTDQNPSRFDILCGAATLQARAAVRAAG